MQRINGMQEPRLLPRRGSKTLHILSLLQLTFAVRSSSNHGAALLPNVHHWRGNNQGEVRINKNNHGMFVPSSFHRLLLRACCSTGTTSTTHDPHVATSNTTTSQSYIASSSINESSKGFTDASSSSSITNAAWHATSTDPIINGLLQKYKGRIVCCTIAQFPHCDVLLCGTLHVAKTSADMVQDVVRSLVPQYIVLELCEARIDNLLEVYDAATTQNVTLVQVAREAYREKSFKVFGMGLLTWMQLKAAKVVGNKLGGELSVAAKVTVTTPPDLFPSLH